MRCFTFHNRRRRRGRAFTLLETALAQIIIGVGVTAMCELLATGSASNVAATELTTAVNLANNIHEIAIGLPFADGGSAVIGTYHDIWDLNGLTFSPPINVTRSAISGYSGWSQQVTVQTVDNNNIGSLRPNDHTVPTARLMVSVSHNGLFIYQASWLVLAADPS